MTSSVRDIHVVVQGTLSPGLNKARGQGGGETVVCMKEAVPVPSDLNHNILG